jgi:outer membrane protein assembly factor BamB
MYRLRFRALLAAGASSLLLAGLAISDTTTATSTTEPDAGEVESGGVTSGDADVAPASTSPATEEAWGGWTNPKGNAGRTGVTDAGPTGEPVELWHFQDGRNCHRQPAIVAGTVYAPCHDGNLYALDAATGTERWRFTATDLGAVVAVGELVYVEVLDEDGPSDTETNALSALDAATGEERWHVSVLGGTGGPVVDDGMLVVGDAEGFFIGLDAATGAELWRYRVSTQGAVDPVALADGIAYGGVDGEGFYAVDATSGTLLWRGDIGGQQVAHAVVAEGVAYIGVAVFGGGGHLYAFDATTGDLLWKGEPLFSPTVLDGVGYTGAEDGTVTAFDTADGTQLWQTELGGAEVLNVAIADGVLYALSARPGGSAVFALDAATGEQLWSVTFQSEAVGGVAVAGGIAVVDTDLAGIYAIGGTDQGAVVPTSSPSSSAVTATTMAS